MEKNPITVNPIGTAECGRGTFRVKIDRAFAPGLKELEGFSHIMLVWLADRTAHIKAENTLIVEKPYTGGPDTIGVFATRSPVRPNPVCVSVCPVKSVDTSAGVIELYYADTENNTPVIDVKPYQPSADRVRGVRTPGWCAGWPEFVEDSADFDWSRVFNF
jgi:tRNA-Thr(GGU) m(6)t(6)A37 methyltransferase TsaA